MDPGLFLNNGWPHIVETEAEVPHILTAFHLSLSDYPFRDSLLNTLILRGLRGVAVYSYMQWSQGPLSRPGGGGGESNVTPHSPGQNQVYSPRKCLHASGIQIKVTIMTRYNIIDRKSTRLHSSHT